MSRLIDWIASIGHEIADQDPVESIERPDCNGRTAVTNGLKADLNMRISASKNTVEPQILLPPA